MPKRLLSRLSIEWKLPAIMGGILLLVTVAYGWSAYRHVTTQLRESTHERLELATRQFTGALQTQARAFRHQTLALASDSAIRSYAGRDDRSGIDVLDERAARRLGVGPLGNRAGPAILRELTQLPGAADSGAVGGFYAFGDTVLHPAIAPIREAGRPGGWVVAWTRIATNARARSGLAGLIGTGALALVGSRGGAWTDQESVLPEPPLDFSRLADVTRYQRPPGTGRLVAAAAVEGTPLVVVIEFPETVIMAPARRFLARLVLIGAALVVLGLLVAIVLGRALARPLRRLTGAASAMQSGNYGSRVSLGREDELGQLADAFNHMAEQVERQASARAESEGQWRTLFASNPHPMWVFDLATHRFLTINDAAVAQYGYSREEFLALRLEDIRPADEVPKLLEDLAQKKDGPDRKQLWRHRRRDGTVFDVEIASHHITFAGRPAKLVLAQDVTERRALEAQFRQAQKMEAVGRLAGGVAHDFNNLLAVINTYSELVRDDLSAGHRSAADLEQIIAAAQRAHALTRQLLAFSRQQVIQPVVFELNGVVSGIDRMLRRVIGEDIELVTAMDPAAGHVKADPGQLEQVLLNLAVNARDAMPDGGRITIETRRLELDEPSARLHGVPQPGGWILLTVTDTGVGMDAPTLSRIFEPFFTTKGEGKGSGLGLATVYGIVTQSDGHVNVYSEPGAGTTFRVYLPALVAPEPSAVPKPALEAPPTGAETIVLAEDEAAVREATARALERLGYVVLKATSPEDALVLAQRHKGPLHLLITDVVMPGMDGPALASSLRAERPELRTLFISGYAGDAIVRRGVIESGQPFLQKPFTIAALAGAVRSALDRTGSAAETPAPAPAP